MTAENFARAERLIHEIDRQDRAQTERVRDILREAGRPDLVEELDRKLKENETGITGARSAWHRISDAQRRTLIDIAENGGRAFRSRMEPASRNYYVTLAMPRGAAALAGRLPTIRNLAARELLAWDGGALDPEAEVVLTERARFVLKHGRPAPGTHFPGYRP